MGFLKILFIFLAVLYLIHLFIRKMEKKALNFLKDLQGPTNQQSHQERVPITEKMVVCAKCGTFNPMSLSIQNGSRFYCSGACSE